QVCIHIPKLPLPFFSLAGEERKKLPLWYSKPRRVYVLILQPLHGFPIIKVMSALRACDGMGMCP
uniref:Uncharacterized protein n=1 Tax=Triticum urartu TaxID=4572 RepID=A0A8R7PH79_TRIUA